MKVAALDLGSNTFLCLIAEVVNDRIAKIYHDSVEIVRLGQGLDKNKRFHPDALVRADVCLRKFSEIIDAHKPEKILAMATSAARDAENKKELFLLAEKYHIPLEIIPGEREAEITYLGAVSGQNETNENTLVVDIGGGSTEFIVGCGRTILAGQSFDIGCVRLTEKFISSQPTSNEEIRRVTDYIDSKIKVGKFAEKKVNRILAVAGTPTSLAAAELGEFSVEKIDGYVFTKTALTRWLEKLKLSTVEEKIKLGIPAGRADVILIGVITLLRTLVLFNLESLFVSTRGVRFGVALEVARRFEHQLTNR